MIQELANNIAASASGDHLRANVLATNNGQQMIQDVKWGFLTQPPTYTGKPVTEQTALQIAAVFACVNVIASDCATLPIRLKRRVGKTVTEITSHPIVKLLNRPNRYRMTGIQVRESIGVQLLCSGNAYARHTRNNRGHLDSIVPLNSRNTTPFLTDEPEEILYYETQHPFQNRRLTLLADEVAHFTGLTQNGKMGLNPIQEMRQAFGQAIAHDEFSGNFFSNGAMVRDTLEMDGTFRDDKAANRVKDDWKKATSGDNAWKTPVLESGMSYKIHTLNLNDLQFLESKRFDIEQIARIFRVPPHKIQHLDRATFNNIAELGIGYYTETLRPWIERLEAVMNLSWLTDRELEDGLFFEHDFQQILRANPKEAAERDRLHIEAGIESRNEVRERNNLNPVAGGEKIQVPMNHQTLEDFISGRQFSKTNPEPKANEDGDGDGDDNQRQFDLTPILADTLEQLRTKEANAISRIREKHPHAIESRLNQFLNTHRDHIRAKLGPIAKALGRELPQQAIEDRLEMLRDFDDQQHPTRGNENIDIKHLAQQLLKSM